MAIPVILSQAYQIENVDVLETTIIQPSTLSLEGMNTVDGYTQIASGSGSWGTGSSVINAYNSSVYLPLNASRSNINDLFFAGDILDADTTLQGIRLQGECNPYENGETTAVLANISMFPIFCNTSLVLSIGGVGFPPKSVTSVNNINLSYAYCTNGNSFELPFGNNKTESRVTAYVYINSTNLTTATTGFIKCQSTFSLGTAVLSGGNRTYEDFQQNTFWNSSEAQGGEEFMDPLAGIMYYLGNNPPGSSFESDSLVVRQFGFRDELIDNGDFEFTQPTLGVLANQLWLGVAHMAAVTALLSTTSDTEYNATVHHITAGRTRSLDYALAAIALLGLWMGALVYTSVRSYRLALAPSLDTYLAARLIVDEVGLVDEGDPSDNPRLRMPFHIPRALARKESVTYQ